jgi:hypothetical protein
MSICFRGTTLFQIICSLVSYLSFIVADYPFLSDTRLFLGEECMISCP